MSPPQRLRWGGVRVIADGGVMTFMNHDPSVAEDGDTSPAKLGRRMRGA
jgi:hypothetical protein